MYKFVLTLKLKPGTRDLILAEAPAAQAATRAEPGCLAYDFFTCTDDPDRLVFIEAWRDQAAHAAHLREDHTRRFIAFHEPHHCSLTFELVSAAEG